MWACPIDPQESEGRQQVLTQAIRLCSLVGLLETWNTAQGLPVSNFSKALSSLLGSALRVARAFVAEQLIVLFRALLPLASSDANVCNVLTMSTALVANLPPTPFLFQPVEEFDTVVALAMTCHTLPPTVSYGLLCISARALQGKLFADSAVPFAATRLCAPAATQEERTISLKLLMVSLAFPDKLPVIERHVTYSVMRP
jgi:hypothetical protein